MQDKRESLREGMLLQLDSGSIYRIKGQPIGYGGGSIIYPAEKIIYRDNQEENDGFEYALKECYPTSSAHQYTRMENGEITAENKKDKEYLDHVKLMMLEEGMISRKIYQKSSRMLPVRESSTHVKFSDGESKVSNTITIMDSLGEKGRALASYMREYKRFTLVQTFDIARQVLWALREVHQAGYLHLDIQDGNIFVQGTLEDASTMVTLIDFGAAREMSHGKTAPIQDKVLFTTEGFSAPEILLKNDGTLQLGVETDLYAVGCLILYLLTGEKYTFQKLMSVTDGKYITRFKMRKIACPKHLIDKMQNIIAHALEVDVERRYHSTDEMLADVVEFLALLKPYRSEIGATKYDAFICYKHGDIDSDAAITLQRKLENFHVSKGVSSKRKPFERIFVDEGELSSCADFGEQIREALKNAEWLIVICSPETPSSPWVQLEIKTFLEYHDRSHIMAVLTEGAPEQSFPMELLGSTDGTGQVLAADARGESKKEILNNINKDVLLKIAAPMAGTTFDSLKQRRRIYQMQRIMVVGVIVLSAAIGFSAYAIQQNRKINVQYQKVLINQSRYLAQISNQLLENGDRTKAIQIAQAALPKSEKDQSRPLVEEALYALNNAIGTYRQSVFNHFTAEYSMQTQGTLSSGQIVMSPKENYRAIIDDNGSLYIQDFKENNFIQEVNAYNFDPDIDDSQISKAVFLSEEQMIIFCKNSFYGWDFKENKILWKNSYSYREYASYYENGWKDGEATLYVGDNVETAYCENNKMFYFAMEKLLYQINPQNGKTIKCIINASQNIEALAVSDSGKYVAIGCSGQNANIYFIDIEKEVCHEYQGVFSAGSIYDLKFLSEKKVAALEVMDPYSKTDGESDANDIESEIPFQISCYNFDTGKIKWKYRDSCMYRDENGDTGYFNMMYTRSFRGTFIRLTQEFKNNKTEDVLLAQYGTKVIYLNPENGALYSSAEAAHDIVCIEAYGQSRQFLMLRDGSIYQLIHANRLAKIGDCNSVVSNAVYSVANSEFATLYDKENKMIVMSTDVEDWNYSIDKSVSDTSFYAAGYVTCEEQQYRYEIYDKNLSFYLPGEVKPCATFDVQDKLHDDSCDIWEIELAKVDGKYLLWMSCWEYDLKYFEKNNSYIEVLDETGNKYQYTFNTEEDAGSLTSLGVQKNKLFIQYDDTDSYICVFDLTKMGSNPKRYNLGEIKLNGHYSVSDDGKYFAAFIGDYSKSKLGVYSFEEEQWLQLSEDFEIESTDSGVSKEEVTFIPETHSLIAANKNHLELLNLDTGKKVMSFEVQYQNRLAIEFISENIMVTINDATELETWNMKTGKKLTHEKLEIGYVKSLYAAKTSEDESYCYIDVSDETQASDELKSIQYVFKCTDHSKMPCVLRTENCIINMQDGEIISKIHSENQYKIRVYQMHTFDELMEMANKITGGKSLTELELNHYFIENN